MEPTIPEVLPENVQPIVETDNSITTVPVQDEFTTNTSPEVPKPEEVSVEVKPEPAVEAKPVEAKPEESKEILNTPSASPSVNIEQISKESLDILITKYLDDGVIDNEELIDIVQTAMEIAEKKREIKGEEKKNLVLLMLKEFMQNRVNDYEKLEPLIIKAIDLAISVSKTGLEKIKLSSDSITESKAAFNLIYQTTLSKIEDKYPLADDIINNLFDIALFIVQLLEGQTNLKENEKRILLKKILIKVIDSLDSKLTNDQKILIKSQIEPTISLVQIGIRASQGEIQINPQEVVSIFSCICAWFTKCCSKKKSTSQ